MADDGYNEFLNFLAALPSKDVDEIIDDENNPHDAAASRDSTTEDITADDETTAAEDQVHKDTDVNTEHANVKRPEAEPALECTQQHMVHDDHSSVIKKTTENEEASDEETESLTEENVTIEDAVQKREDDAVKEAVQTHEDEAVKDDIIRSLTNTECTQKANQPESVQQVANETEPLTEAEPSQNDTTEKSKATKKLLDTNNTSHTNNQTNTNNTVAPISTDELTRFPSLTVNSMTVFVIRITVELSKAVFRQLWTGGSMLKRGDLEDMFDVAKRQQCNQQQMYRK
eukprot:scaffold33217_cov22-Cyclotella_meneghiniana.AAC.3